jgi:hypothetical protein
LVDQIEELISRFVPGFDSCATGAIGPGNIIGSGSNQANYGNVVYSVTQSSTLDSSQNYLTDGGAFSGSASYYPENSDSTGRSAAIC